MNLMLTNYRVLTILHAMSDLLPLFLYPAKATVYTSFTFIIINDVISTNRGRDLSIGVRRNLLRPALTSIAIEPNVEDFSFAPPLVRPLLYRNDIFCF